MEAKDGVWIVYGFDSENAYLIAGGKDHLNNTRRMCFEVTY